MVFSVIGMEHILFNISAILDVAKKKFKAGDTVAIELTPETVSNYILIDKIIKGESISKLDVDRLFPHESKFKQALMSFVNQGVSLEKYNLDRRRLQAQFLNPEYLLVSGLGEMGIKVVGIESLYAATFAKKHRARSFPRLNNFKEFLEFIRPSLGKFVDIPIREDHFIREIKKRPNLSGALVGATHSATLAKALKKSGLRVNHVHVIFPGHHAGFRLARLQGAISRIAFKFVRKKGK